MEYLFRHEGKNGSFAFISFIQCGFFRILLSMLIKLERKQRACVAPVSERNRKKHANDKQNILKLAISKLSFGIIQAIFHIKSEMVILFPSQSLFRWLNIYNMSFIVDCFSLSLSLSPLQCHEKVRAQ